MHYVGTVESLWRYPVKSMCGEEVESAHVDFSGLRGDRRYAIHDDAAQVDFPYLTARQNAQMLLFRPRFRSADASLPPDGSLIEDLALEIETPDGRCLALEDPDLLGLLAAVLDDRHQLSLIHADQAIADACPFSLFSAQTAQQLGEDLGIPIDKRRFRANIYLDLKGMSGFAEDQFVGRSLKIGDKTVLSVLERDPRCKIITLDPDTTESNPEVMKRVASAYERCAGIYAKALVEGEVRRGDAVHLLD